MEISSIPTARQLLRDLVTKIDWQFARRRGFDVQGAAGELAEALHLPPPAANCFIPFESREDLHDAHRCIAQTIRSCIDTWDQQPWYELHAALREGKLLPLPRLDSGRTLAAYLNDRSRRNWFHLGAGVFSTVYTRLGSNRVLKVNQTPDAGLEYLLWANEAGFGGHEAPKMFSARTFEDGTYVVLMERLEAGISDIVPARYMRAYSAFRDALYAYDRSFSPFVAAFADRFGRRQLDIHSANFMLRRDGTMVLTDPFCGASDYNRQYSRIKL